jgi:hypothetical protein
MNPLIPGPGDTIFALVALANLVLVIAAITVLVRAADKRRWLPKLLLIVLVPIAGPIVAIVTSRPLGAASD